MVAAKSATSSARYTLAVGWAGDGSTDMASGPHIHPLAALQNLSGVHVYFLGAAGTLPMGVAILFAAVAGALLIALFGSARVLQLRRAARRRRS